MKKQNKEDIVIIFGQKLRPLRRENQMSMDELSLKLGIAKSALSKYENGLVIPSLVVARRLADYFRVTVDWLSGGSLEGDSLASVPQPFTEVVRYAMDRNLTPEKLKLIIDAITS